MIGYLALLRFLFQIEVPFRLVRQISLPSIRENWAGKKEMSCTFKATTLTRVTLQCRRGNQVQGHEGLCKKVQVCVCFEESPIPSQ